MRNLKNKIVGFRQAKMTHHKTLSTLSKKENIKTSLSTVQRIGLKYEREGSIYKYIYKSVNIYLSVCQSVCLSIHLLVYLS